MCSECGFGLWVWVVGLGVVGLRQDRDGARSEQRGMEVGAAAAKGEAPRGPHEHTRYTQAAPPLTHISPAHNVNPDPIHPQFQPHLAQSKHNPTQKLKPSPPHHRVNTHAPDAKAPPQSEVVVGSALCVVKAERLVDLCSHEFVCQFV